MNRVMRSPTGDKTIQAAQEEDRGRTASIAKRTNLLRVEERRVDAEQRAVFVFAGVHLRLGRPQEPCRQRDASLCRSPRRGNGQIATASGQPNRTTGIRVISAGSLRCVWPQLITADPLRAALQTSLTAD